MTDRMTPEQRRKCMQGNKSKDTKPELIVRRFLFSRGIHYRLHCTNLPGKPDIVLRKYSTVIFINGCFWHGHDNCQYFKMPSSNVDFWRHKIETNKERDLADRTRLVGLGWGVMVVWECQLRPQHREQTLNEILYHLSMAYLKKKKVEVLPKIKTYEIESDTGSVAAEDKVGYNNQ